MTESRIPEAIDAIIAALTTAQPDLQVWDGPIISGDYTNAVYIGFDGQYEDSEELAVSAQQEWAGIGRNARNEDLQITCSVVVLTGNADTAWKPTRDAAYSIIEAVGQVLRADPSVGLPPPVVAELVPGDFYQETGPAGMQARVLFSIHLKTRV
ncbi:hypothetical protein [Amycolatopsis speibonae]|uniref:DUF3168 domain-containing protein n=1 Tax=Amycolatopsis speibonae TaxID=1450224 RepID=A0ABV7P4I2_9PSEU